MNNFNDIKKAYYDRFNGVLKKFYGELTCQPKVLKNSLVYSLKVGGKRIRPILVYATGDILGVPLDDLDNFALAIELIHTYSLIHDDLPAMDDDEFRRGKPANHVVFGSGNAILAGDGLLNTAYSILFSECKKGENRIAAAEFVCNCAGVYGMIAGQSADLLHGKDGEYNEENLSFIYENKTAKLITAPIVVPSILSGGKYYPLLKEFGANLGCLFQLTDDILDEVGNFWDMGKTTGKDYIEKKCTAVKLYGVDGAKIRADVLADKCLKLLEGINGDTEFMKELVRFVLTRKN